MAGYFELKREDAGYFQFHLKAGNHEIILSSPLYQAPHEAIEGIEAARRNAGIPERYQRKVARDNSPYFVLSAPDGEVIGKSAMYSSAAAMETGIRSVMANGMSPQVRGLDLSTSPNGRASRGATPRRAHPTV